MNPPNDHELLLWAMRAGLTRDEVRQAVQLGLEKGAIPRQTFNETSHQQQERFQAVQEYLQDQYLAGYSDYIERIRSMNAQRAARESGSPFQREEPMAPWQWRQLPSHTRGRWLSSLHEDLATRDDYNRLAMGPEWVKRQGSSHLFGIEAVTQSSFLGIEDGRTLTTWDAGKVMKRIQLLGAHEQVGLTDVPTRRGYIKPGPASVGPDEFSQLRSAFIIGGEPGPSGQGYIDPSVGNVTSRRVMDVYAKPGESLTGLPGVGTQWLPGQEVRLANELTGFTDRNWGYEVRDYAPITRQVMQGGEMVEQTGYRFVLGREADLSTARVRAKAYGTKLELVRGDLSGIIDPVTGQSLGVQFAGAMKDVQGTVYSHFLGRDPHYLAKEIGMDVADLPGSYAELGAKPMAAMERLAERHIRTINWPATVHESQLAQYAPVTVGDPEPLGGGLYRIQRQYQAFVDETAAVALSRDYDVRSPFLNRTELTHIKRTQPELYRQIMRDARGVRSAYSGVASAALASTGEYELPRGAVGLRPEAMQATYTRALEQARERLGLGELQMVSRHAVAKELVDILGEGELSRHPMVFGSGENAVVSPSARQLQHFRAGGRYIDEEVAPMMGALTEMFETAGTDRFAGAVQRFRHEQATLAGGEKFVRKMTGAYVSKSRMMGDVARGSDALAPYEVYVPAMEGAFNVARFPTQGEMTWDPRLTAVGISRAEAVKRGLDPDSMYASTTIMQSVAGDNDGDLVYMLKRGEAVRGPDGHIYGPGGQRLDTAGHWEAAAKAAEDTGAARLVEEYVGMDPKRPGAPTREQAVQQFVDKALNPQRFTAADLGAQVEQGMDLYGDIGQYYNTFVRGMANIDPDDVAGRGAMQRLWNLSHGRAQRPERLTPGMQQIQDLMTYNVASGGVYQRAAGGPGKVSGGMTGLMREATRALLRDDLPTDVIAAAMAPYDARTDVAAAIQRYRTARGPVGERMERLQLEMGAAIGGVERWATASPLGQLLGGQAVRTARGPKRDIGYGQIATGLGISESAVYGLEQAAVRAERQVNINRKVQRYDPTAERPLGALADVIEDIRAAGVPVTGGLPVPAGGGGGRRPPPPTTTAAPADDPGGWQFVGTTGDYAPRHDPSRLGSKAWWDSIEPIPYADQVPFSREDLSPAERAKARQTPVKIQGASGVMPIAGGNGAGLIETMVGMGVIDPNAPGNRIMVKQVGSQLSFTKLGDNLPELMKQLDVYDYGARVAMSGGEIFEDRQMLARFQKAGFKPRDLEDLQRMATSVRAGQLDPAAARGVSFRYSQLHQAAAKAGALENALDPYDIGGFLQGAAGGAQRRGFSESLRTQREIHDQFGDLGENLKKYNQAITESTESLQVVKEKMQDLPEPAEQLAGELRALKRRVGFEESYVGKAQGRLAGQVGAIEKAGLSPFYGDELAEAKATLAARKGFKGDIDAFETAIERRAFEAEEEIDRRGRREQGSFRRVGRIFGMAMLPWQLQFAKQWGTMQAEEAAQYASGIDLQMAQAQFAMGAPVDMGSYAHMRDVQMRKSWAQYYFGQGGASADIAGLGGFAAENPAFARGAGAAARYGQFMGYGLALELAASQVAGRSLVLGRDSMIGGLLGGLAPAVGGAAAVAGAYMVGKDVLEGARGEEFTWREYHEELEQSSARLIRDAFGGVGKGLVKVPGLRKAGRPLLRFAYEHKDPGDFWYAGEKDELPPAQKADEFMRRFQEAGFTPDEAAAYSRAYADQGLSDTDELIQRAARVREVEQLLGVQPGALAGTGNLMGNIGLGIAGGYNQRAGQIGAQLEEYLLGLPSERIKPTIQGLQQASQQWGDWASRLGMGADWQTQQLIHTGEMVAGGMSPWEVGKYVQSQTLSTPYAWSQRMREWGVEGMALVDELGRPANYQESRALELAQRDWGRRMQEFSLAQTGEQLGMQREWMTRGWAIEDQIRPLRQRYRVEDADMGILSLQNRLQDFRDRQEVQELQRSQDDRRFQWRMEDLETQGVRAGIQWGWQQQDFRENRQQSATQLGWQLEDFQEAIRFASGRQRRRLIEQRERAVVQAQWGRRDMAQAEERAEMRFEWGEEDREKAMERLREEYGMREEFQHKAEESEKRSLEYLQKQLEMAQARREELVNLIIPAEEQQEALQREQAEQGLAWREERHAMDTAYYEAIQPLQDALTEKTDAMNEAWQAWQLVMSEGVPKAAELFLKSFGPHSDAYKAIEKWQEALKSFEGLGQGGGAIGAAVESKISQWMEQQFPTYSLR